MLSRGTTAAAHSYDTEPNGRIISIKVSVVKLLHAV
jgi:hypothetical protein